MKRFTEIGLLIVIWGVSFFGTALGQVPYRLNDKEMESLMKRIEDSSDRFRKSFDHSLDRSHISGREKDSMKVCVKDFENAADRLKDRFSKKNSAAGDVEEVLNQAGRINEFMTRDILETQTRNDWMNLRGKLDELARAYDVSWRWTGGYIRGSRTNREDMESLLDRTKRDFDHFRYSLNDALARERFDDVRSEDRIHQLVMDLQADIDQLHDHFRRNDLTSNDIMEVQRRSVRIDRFMARNSLDSRTQNDWTTLRRDFDQMARIYDIAWNW